jgi:cytochrome oxidase assembly protein ShyY1
VRFLLRPGWIALTVAVLGFAFACYYLLAPWQFHRSVERDGTNAALTTAVSTPPVAREELVPAGSAPRPPVEWRQVVVAGTYVPAGEVLVRLRTVEGHPAYEVMTPLRTVGGETVLIDRGYVRAVEQGALPPVAGAPPGPVVLTGYQRLDEGPSDRPALVADGHRQVYTADAATISAAGGVAASPGYVQLQAGQAGVLTAVPLPQPDPNPSYSYAWQWLIFGLMAIGAWVYFVRLEYRSGRGLAPRRDADDPRDAADGTPWDADDTAARRTQDVLADRYGRR